MVLSWSEKVRGGWGRMLSLSSKFILYACGRVSVWACQLFGGRVRIVSTETNARHLNWAVSLFTQYFSKCNFLWRGENFYETFFLIWFVTQSFLSNEKGRLRDKPRRRRGRREGCYNRNGFSLLASPFTLPSLSHPRHSSPHTFSYLTVLFPFSPRHKGAVKHIEVKEGTRGGYGFAANYTTHPTLCDLVKHYHVNTLQVHNPELDTTLKFPLGRTAVKNS